ncbi:hypothetical protein [Methylobacterium durans]|uniref:Uncharacterized protein n=1 Tax=Methylobacterium durans TaxID=2202825 RepID=A0A2U8W2K7_9HYPH|nr:hypothetical protein [Methylobacterium durans]AWN39898.1 hypothetical protein DK389_04290 [Methylobacterium durans]
MSQQSATLEAIYLEKLERLPSDDELRNWEVRLVEKGDAVVRAEIAQSAEAAAVTARRQQRAELQRKSDAFAILRRARARIDAHMSELLSEIVAEPVSIGLRQGVEALLPAGLLERLTATSAIRIESSTVAGEQDIAVLLPDDLTPQSDSSRTTLVLLDSWRLAGARSSRPTFRNSYEDWWAAAVSRLPPRAGHGPEPIHLDPGAARGFDPTPSAVLFEANDLWRTSRLEPRTIATAAVLHHFLTERPKRVIAALDLWDRSMGSELARRYKALAAPPTL